MTQTQIDVIDRLVGITPGSTLDAVRRNRIQARDNAQLSYEALFAPEDARHGADRGTLRHRLFRCRSPS